MQQLELIKKSIGNNRTKEKRTAQTNTKFYENTVANGMSGKIIAQPSVRHALFAKEKITCRCKKKVEEVKDTQVDRGGAEFSC